MAIIVEFESSLRIVFETQYVALGVRRATICTAPPVVVDLVPLAAVDEREGRVLEDGRGVPGALLDLPVLDLVRHDERERDLVLAPQRLEGADTGRAVERESCAPSAILCGTISGKWTWS